MKLAGKDLYGLSIWFIFLGTGLMATAIKACFDASDWSQEAFPEQPFW